MSSFLNVKIHIAPLNLSCSITTIKMLFRAFDFQLNYLTQILFRQAVIF